MKRRFFLLIFPVIAVILEILPGGVAMNFADIDALTGEIKVSVEKYSYFSMMPFGYGNHFPLITAALTCVIAVLAAVYAFTGKRPFVNAVFGLSIAALVVSVVPVVFRSYTLTGIFITASMVGSVIFARAERINNKE